MPCAVRIQFTIPFSKQFDEGRAYYIPALQFFAKHVLESLEVQPNSTDLILYLNDGLGGSNQLSIHQQLRNSHSPRIILHMFCILSLSDIHINAVLFKEKSPCSPFAMHPFFSFSEKNQITDAQRAVTQRTDARFRVISNDVIYNILLATKLSMINAVMLAILTGLASILHVVQGR